MNHFCLLLSKDGRPTVTGSRGLVIFQSGRISAVVISAHRASQPTGLPAYFPRLAKVDNVILLRHKNK